MPKRIEFIAPVEAMRGNLSGRQTLEYAENNNRAYESPVGKTNYAKNYRASFIGAKRASDGLKYFAVKTKTATTMSANAVHMMALMGGTGAIVADILNGAKVIQQMQSTSPKRIFLVELYDAYKQKQDALAGQGEKLSLRKFLTDAIRAALDSKAQNIIFAGTSKSVTLANPWIASHDALNPAPFGVSDEILAKFYTELGVRGAYVFNMPLPNGKVLKVIGAPDVTWNALYKSTDSAIPAARAAQNALNDSLGDEYAIQSTDAEVSVISNQELNGWPVMATDEEGESVAVKGTNNFDTITYKYSAVVRS